VEQFLGALSFAKQLNRTFILPPFISYPHTKPQAQMTPFADIFEVSEISKYHRVIQMDKFMRELSPTIWPKEKRLAFCWQPRKSIYDETAPPSCNAKEGNPFGSVFLLLLFSKFLTISFLGHFGIMQVLNLLVMNIMAPLVMDMILEELQQEKNGKLNTLLINFQCYRLSLHLPRFQFEQKIVLYKNI
jgi:hypothetical protein